MSGHSKWSQIKHQKAITDKKRGQVFSKAAKLISLAARKGVNPENNLELRGAIDRAKSINVPNENIQRAIRRVSDKSSAQLEELLVEAIGPRNIAIQIKAVTDNRNRTISELKKILADNNSKMVTPGSIAWMLNQPTIVADPVFKEEIDKLFEALDDHDDVEEILSNITDQS